jgi:predicted membrane-bound mannosyltransferase/DNA-binding beta-propeller fold protein YncE
MDAKPAHTSLLDLPLKRWFPANLETLAVILLLLLAVITRFTGLGDRAMSHDEVNHVVPTYDLYAGRIYRYDPMSHGPIQYHMMALSYALFGDNDFTSRIPAALFGVASLAFVAIAYRRYLGRTGALLAGVLMLISPFMLFYARYARNEIYIVLWAVLTLYAILRYLERGETWAMLLFTLANGLHFTDKATSYMFAGMEFLFLAGILVDRLARRSWAEDRPQARSLFLTGLLAMVVLAAAALAASSVLKPLENSDFLLVGGLALLAVGGLALAIVQAVRGLGLPALKSERPLDLLILLSTFLLPLVSAIPLGLINTLLVKLGKIPDPGFAILDYTTAGVIRVASASLILAAIAVAIGLWWFGRRWLYQAAVFFIPLVVLYTSFFTYPEGLIGGLVGALSYWAEQQGVARGSQPIYYYALLLIPVYEFLPALGTVAAAVIASVKKLWQVDSQAPFKRLASNSEQQAVPTAALLVYWSVASLAVFTYAGEKMPWLTIHIALPMILACGWALGWMIESIPWGRLADWGRRHYARAVPLAFFGLLALITARSAYRAAYINYDYPFEYLVYAHGAPYPKALFGQIEELSYRITGGTDLVVAYDNNVRYPYWWYMRAYANKIDFDVNPTRDLARAPIIAVSDANNDKLAPVVRDNYYDESYMRLWWPSWDYWNLKWQTILGERNSALIQANQDEIAANPDANIPPLTVDDLPPMTVFEYLKYAWKLHFKQFFTDPKVRSAVWQIWFNRDFTEWAALKGSDGYTLTNWYIAERMHFYIRKDIQTLLWPYGAEAVPIEIPVDPYAGLITKVTPDITLGRAGSEAGEFASPRAVAVAPDGSLYVADSLNHRIQHLKPDGEVLQVWGSYANVSDGNAPGGTFNEPWGVAVGPDGSVYVADTWNYRIQKFTAEGQFIRMWGHFGLADALDAFYGPRGIAVDGQGRVYVADTGNKRIVVFDADGNPLTQIGSPGMQLGQLDEPVALALDAFGNIYVTDTWNLRVQVFAPDSSGLYYTTLAEWPISGWYGQSLQNKPFITADADGRIYATDPEGCRVIEFSSTGETLKVMDGCAGGAFALPSGIAADGAGGLWVTDASQGTVVHITIPPNTP